MAWQKLLARTRALADHGLRPGQSSAARPLSGPLDPQQTASLSLRRLLLIGVCLLAAVAVDWFVVPWSYPVAAAYGIALLLAAHALPPRGVIGTTCLAVALSLTSTIIQRAPLVAAVADNTSLVVVGVLAWLLARQREVAITARRASEAAEHRIELAYEAARALAEATTLEMAGASMLASVSRQLGWTCGVLWWVNHEAGDLVCAATWHEPHHTLNGFDRDTKALRVVRGVGLPGQVWASGQPLWIPDVEQEVNFPRRGAATAYGLHTGFGFPIRHAGDILGVMEFFDAESRHPDRELLALMDTLGAQIGLFLARRQAEARASALFERERVARSEADAAVRVRDEFLAAASHDLRGPLSAIGGYAALARRNLAAGNTQRVVDSLARVEAGVKRLGAALSELLDLAQLQAGQQLALHLASMDLVELVRRLAADYAVADERCNIRIVSDVPELIGSWDAPRLERALGNVLANAVKYSPPGAEVLVAVRVAHEACGDWAVVQVRDQGIGIPAADLPHIFERFYRAANVSDHLPGTGLGLAGARDVLEQHAGAIAVESSEGHGSVFTVRLPLRVGEIGGVETRGT